MMSKKDFAQSILSRRLIISRDWFGDITGLLPYFALWGATATTLYFEKNGRNLFTSALLFFCLGAVFFYGIYCLICERNLTVFKTELSIPANRELVLAALNKLNWRVIENHPQEIKAAVFRKWYGFIQQTATVLIIDNTLFINVIHRGSFKGRIPFSFGQNEQKLTMLIDAIQTL